jgi:iron complex outermembrane receptor protein
VINTEGQDGYGTEVEWDWAFHQQWNLKGNYAWQNAKDKQTNRRVSGVPEHQVYVAFAWQVLPQWQLQTQLNWVGHRLNLDASTNDELKDYQTIDVTLNSKRFYDAVDFTASVRNVFDAQGKEGAVNSYKENLPIASRSFYLQATLYF